MKQFVFLTDIDGTLVRGDIGMTPGVIAAARAFTQAGGLLAVCTGRSDVAALEIARTLGVNCPSILYGGASLYDCTAQTHIRSWAFADAPIRTSIALAMEHCPGISMQVLTAKQIYVLRRNRRLNERGVKEENQGELRTLAQVEGKILKLVMCGDDVAELEACRQYFSPELCQFAFSSRNFVDVVAAGFGKADTMRALSAQLEIPLERFFYAGDGMTDLPTLRLAGTSFAPENALDAVKKEVDLVIPDVAQGGMEVAFRHALEQMRACV